MESIKTSDFRRLKKSGFRVYPARWMLILSIAGKKPRLGITIPKTVANSVLRNKLKRWTRECFRQNKNLPKADMNIVFRKKKNYKELKYYELEKVVHKGFIAILERTENN